MLSLQPHHIINVFVMVDDMLPIVSKKSQIGRPTLLSNSELVTILLWNTITIKQSNYETSNTTTKGYSKSSTNSNH